MPSSENAVLGVTVLDWTQSHPFGTIILTSLRQPYKKILQLNRRSSCQELRTERASDPPAVRRLSHRQLLAQVTKKQ
ncbi:unnamed protein product [Caretta caretta]